jgi:TPR repeat protein
MLWYYYDINHMKWDTLKKHLSSQHDIKVTDEYIIFYELIKSLFIDNNSSDFMNEIYKVDDANLGMFFYIYGSYYAIKHDYKQMMSCLFMAVEGENSFAMNNLGLYFYKTKDYDNMLKYYLMAIKLNNSDAMNNLGYYYFLIEQDYDQMKKYYLMAIALGDACAMNNLGFYYYLMKKHTHTSSTPRHKLMKKYFLMAIENGDLHAMNNLGHYYKQIGDYKKQEKYYLMPYKAGSQISLDQVFHYDLHKYNYIKTHHLQKSCGSDYFGALQKKLIQEGQITIRLNRDSFINVHIVCAS